MPTKYKVCMARFCLSCHKLEIETGRYHKPYPKRAHERICRQCPSGRVEDQAHFLFSCEKIWYPKNKTLFRFTRYKCYTQCSWPKCIENLWLWWHQGAIMPGKIYIAMPTLKKLNPTNRQTCTTVFLHNHFLCLYFVSVLCKLFYQLFFCIPWHTHVSHVVD